MLFKVIASTFTLALATVVLANGTMDTMPDDNPVDPPKDDTTKPDESDPNTDTYGFKHYKGSDNANTFTLIVLKKSKS